MYRAIALYRGLKQACVIVAAAQALWSSPALMSRASADSRCTQGREDHCAKGADGGFIVGLSGGSSGRTASGATSGHGNKTPVALSATFVQTRHVPTCLGNGVDGPDSLCTAAVGACPSVDEVRFWVYRREVNRATNAPSPWTLVTEPPFVCLGPTDPAVVIDPRVAIAAMIEQEFKRVVVLKGVAEVSPRPDTLVNIPTRFTTDAPDSYDIPLTLLGLPVTITATAERWTWHFGDGTSASTSAAGTKGRVEHVYRRSTDLGAHVAIEWSGTYRVAGGPSLPITGTATTVGDPTPLSVKQARTDLVADSS